MACFQHQDQGQDKGHKDDAEQEHRQAHPSDESPVRRIAGLRHRAASVLSGRTLSRKSPAESSAGQNGGGAMAKTRYAPDRGLIARMGLTMFLLGVVFVAFILALVLVLEASHRGSGAGIVILPVLLAIGLGFGSFYWSDKIALRTAGARLVTPQDGPQAAQLHGVV